MNACFILFNDAYHTYINELSDVLTISLRNDYKRR